MLSMPQKPGPLATCDKPHQRYGHRGYRTAVGDSRASPRQCTQAEWSSNHPKATSHHTSILAHAGDLGNVLRTFEVHGMGQTSRRHVHRQLPKNPAECPWLEPWGRKPGGPPGRQGHETTTRCRFLASQTEDRRMEEQRVRTTCT
jgi:hypothetical protein